MRIRIGEVEALFRYPVKSMRGERIERSDLGWHGLGGDRRLALRRVSDRSGFPWLTASKLPELILFVPQRAEGSGDEALPTHVRTPERRDLELFGPELAADIAERHGGMVEMTHLNRGIFDEASVSLITSATVDAIGDLTGQPADVRRFRPNIVIRTVHPAAYEEDAWVHGVLTFGESEDAAAITITNRDERCAMVNFDADSARTTPEVLRAIVRTRGNMAGVYGSTTNRGRIEVGQPIFLQPAAASMTKT